MEQVHLTIHGRVQGVFFRANTQKEAARLGITGWVRNTPDGGVETVAQGGKELLKEFVEWCHHGPPYAQVSKVDVLWQKSGEEFQGFNIRY